MRILTKVLVILCLLITAKDYAAKPDLCEMLKDARKKPTIEQIHNAVVQGAEIDSQNEYGLTPLMIASGLYDDPEIIKALLAAGADINARSAHGMTALMGAAQTNANSVIIETLIKAGADVNAKIGMGFTVLMSAAWRNKNPEVILMLLNAGADPSLKDNNGKTAADYGAENENLVNTTVYKKLKQSVSGL